MLSTLVALHIFVQPADLSARVVHHCPFQTKKRSQRQENNLLKSYEEILDANSDYFIACIYQALNVGPANIFGTPVALYPD